MIEQAESTCGGLTFLGFVLHSPKRLTRSPDLRRSGVVLTVSCRLQNLLSEASHETAFGVPRGCASSRVVYLSEGFLCCFYTTSIPKIKLDYPSALGNTPFHFVTSTWYYWPQTNISLAQIPRIGKFNYFSVKITNLCSFSRVRVRVTRDRNGFKTSGTPCI